MGTLVTCFCYWYFILPLLAVENQCDVNPSRIQRYVGIRCALNTTSFRVSVGEQQKFTFLSVVKLAGRCRTERIVPQGPEIPLRVVGMGMLWGHKQEAQLFSYLKDGVSAFKSRTEEYRAQRSSRTGATRSRERSSSITYRRTTPSSYGRKLQLYFNGDVWSTRPASGARPVQHDPRRCYRFESSLRSLGLSSTLERLTSATAMFPCKRTTRRG